MLDKKTLVGTAHLISTGLILKTLSFILPCYITSQYSCAANLLLLIVIAKITYGYAKRNFLNERVQPVNKAVLITGCDSGFGNGLAKRLDSRGYHVFASCLDVESEGAKELKERCTNRLQVLKMDVKSDDSVKEALKFVKEKLGTSEFWALVNNAGVLRGCSVELTDMEDFVESMEVNTFGKVRVTKAFLPLLRQWRGRVVNVTSVIGKVPAAYLGPYTLSEFASTAFSECLRQEMRVWGVKVISIEPEFFQTPFTKAENVAKGFEKVSESSRAVMEDYGEDYEKKLKESLARNSHFCSPKVTKVISDLELAISLKYPDSTYTPCRNNAIRLFYYLMEISPNPLKDMFMDFNFYVTGFPVPKEAVDGYLD